MGLIYVESFLEHFEEARTYISRLIASAIDPEVKHIAVHQAGMTERMAGDPYSVEEVQELLKNISSVS